MHALPFLIALASAAVLAPARAAHARRGRPHQAPTTAAARCRSRSACWSLAAALIALIPLMLLQVLASAGCFTPRSFPIAVYALGVLALGLVDDTLGERADGERARRPPRRAAGAATARRCCAASCRPAR